MRALLVVMPDMLFENLLEVALTEYKDVSEHSRRMVPTKRSTTALAFGERIGV
jgi:hypothetical protein